MALGGIPLKMFGTNVGTARINDDGTIDLIMISPCQLGVSLLDGFKTGLFTDLSVEVSGTIQPVEPATLNSKKGE
jgi:hypothetical protein